MAIGPVTIKAKDADNATRNIRALSSDATTGGDLSPVHALVDAAQIVVNPATKESVEALAAKIPALSEGRLPVDIGSVSLGVGSSAAANAYVAISSINTSISVLAANPSRKTVFLQNLDANTVLAVGLNGMPAAYATSGAVELQPKQTLTLEGGEAANALALLSSKLNHQYTLSVGS